MTIVHLFCVQKHIFPCYSKVAIVVPNLPCWIDCIGFNAVEASLSPTLSQSTLSPFHLELEKSMIKILPLIASSSSFSLLFSSFSLFISNTAWLQFLGLGPSIFEVFLCENPSPDHNSRPKGHRSLQFGIVHLKTCEMDYNPSEGIYMCLGQTIFEKTIHFLESRLIFFCVIG